MAASDRAFYTLDNQLRFVSAGPRALAMWGKTSKDLLGRKITDAFPRLEGGAVHKALEQALSSLRPVRLEVESIVLCTLVDVEIFPVIDVLQVSFTPAKRPNIG